MTPNLRIYATEQAAIEADQLLADKGFLDRTLILPSKVAGREAQAVTEAVDSGMVPERYRNIAIESLKEGHPVLAAMVPFGAGEMVTLLMERGETVHTDRLRRYRFNDPAPLSSALGIPTLSRQKASNSLISSNWTLTSGLLSSKPAPLSSIIGLKPVIRRKRDWKYSWGLPILSRNAAPLSSLFGMPTLSKPRDRSRSEWTLSFGFPVLIKKSPAPLSSLFGMPVLQRQRSEPRK